MCDECYTLCVVIVDQRKCIIICVIFIVLKLPRADFHPERAHVMYVLHIAYTIGQSYTEIFIYFFFALLSLKEQKTKGMGDKIHTSDQQKDGNMEKWETIEKYINVFSMETEKNNKNGEWYFVLCVKMMSYCVV